VKGWLSRCAKDCIRCRTGIETRLPDRILDLGQESSPNNHIVLSETRNEPEKYFYLSYCFGDLLTMVKTTSKTFDTYKGGIWVETLPKTFRDTVTIIRRIGIRWLSIDSLCIIQDDSAAWACQSSKMAEIYSGAYLPIAASRSANSDRGLFSMSSPEYNYIQFDFTDGLGTNHELGVRWQMPHCELCYVDLAEDLPLFHRGWAFQSDCCPHEFFIILRMSCCGNVASQQVANALGNTTHTPNLARK
jgi:hypothetical protein